MPFKTSINLVFVFLFFASCSDGGGLNMNPAKYFNSIQYLEGNEVLTFDDFGIYRPVSMVMNDDYIYVQNYDEDMI